MWLLSVVWLLGVWFIFHFLVVCFHAWWVIPVGIGISMLWTWAFDHVLYGEED